jgi:hypothetical protein
MATRRQRQVAFVPEIPGIFRVRRKHFIQDLGHCPPVLLRVVPAGRVAGKYGDIVLDVPKSGITYFLPRR